jgi:ABC-type metal ion transport system substrate-binding protein
MILKNVVVNIQPFTLKGFSTIYRALRHFSDNVTTIEDINNGRTVSVPSDKSIELVPLETL